jgi:hypothetical protein
VVPSSNGPNPPTGTITIQQAGTVCNLATTGGTITNSSSTTTRVGTGFGSNATNSVPYMGIDIGGNFGLGCFSVIVQYSGDTNYAGFSSTNGS